MTTVVQPGSAANQSGHRRSRRRTVRYRAVPYGLVGPFYALFVIFTIGPLLYAAYLSLYNRTLTGSNLFVGLGNYNALLHASDFWSGMLSTALLGVIEVPVMLVVAIFLAVVLDMKLARFGNVFRLIYFVPFAIPGVVAAIMWGYLLVPDLSPFDVILSKLGLGTPNLLGSGFLWPALGNMLIWELVGYNMLIIYTALQTVPRELTEAAVLDGANAWSVAVKVRLPVVRGAITLTALFSIIGTLQLFTEPLLLANLSGSISSHLTPNMYLYNQASVGQQTNLAAAGALILALIIGVASGVVLATLRRTGARRG